MRAASERREELRQVWETARVCTRCPELVRTRHTVVFGSGNADAALMFVGEAPGANEDRRGLPFVGQAGSLLDRLLAGIGLTREDVFVANVLKCRPPGNRDPLAQEIENCRGYLLAQLELIEPAVVCTLGNFATKLLRGDQATGITRLHGRVEERVIGPRAVRLYPLLHPAAALYTPKMLATLEADFARIPELLSQPALEQPSSGDPAPGAAAAASDPAFDGDRAAATHAQPELAGAASGPAPAVPAEAAMALVEPELGDDAAPAEGPDPDDEHVALGDGEPAGTAAAPEQAEPGGSAAAPAEPGPEPVPGQLGLF